MTASDPKEPFALFGVARQYILLECAMTRRGFRALVVFYLATWVTGIVLGIFDTSYEVSDRLHTTSWEMFQAASLVGLALYVVSALGLLFFARWSRYLFLGTWFYVLVYEYIYGSGSGAALVHTFGTMTWLAAGAIIYGSFFDPIAREFRNGQ